MLANSKIHRADESLRITSRQMSSISLPTQKPMILTAFLRCASFVASGLLAVTSALAGQAQYSGALPSLQKKEMEAAAPAGERE